MRLQINIKNMGKKGRRIKPVSFEYEKCPETAEELIEDTVRTMVELFIERQKLSQSGAVPDPISEENIKSMAEIGKIAFGYIYNLRANTRDFSHEIQPFLHMHFTNDYNIS